MLSEHRGGSEKEQQLRALSDLAFYVRMAVARNTAGGAIATSLDFDRWRGVPTIHWARTEGVKGANIVLSAQPVRTKLRTIFAHILVASYSLYRFLI